MRQPWMILRTQANSTLNNSQCCMTVCGKRESQIENKSIMCLHAHLWSSQHQFWHGRHSKAQHEKKNARKTDWTAIQCRQTVKYNRVWTLPRVLRQGGCWNYSHSRGASRGRENRQSAADDPLELQKQVVEAQQHRKIAHHYKGIYRIELQSVSKNPKAVNMWPAALGNAMIFTGFPHILPEHR